LKNATAYRLQIATSATDPSDAVLFSHPLKTVFTDKTSYRLKVIGAQFYYWRVQASVGGSFQKYTPSIHFAVAKPAVGIPRPLSPPNGVRKTAGRVSLCWSGVSGSVGYVLKLNGSNHLVSGTCFTISTSPRTYSWSVAARVQGVQIYTGDFS